MDNILIIPAAINCLNSLATYDRCLYKQVRKDKMISKVWQHYFNFGEFLANFAPSILPSFRHLVVAPVKIKDCQLACFKFRK